jgi:hypothetical protein
MEYLKQIQKKDDNKINNLINKTRTYNCNSSQLSLINESTRRNERDISPIRTDLINNNRYF